MLDSNINRKESQILESLARMQRSEDENYVEGQKQDFSVNPNIV